MLNGKIKKFLLYPATAINIFVTTVQITFAGFPNVLGCIDGTQIKIQAPHENEAEFVCRKGYHSINVQVQYISYSENLNHPLKLYT